MASTRGAPPSSLTVLRLPSATNASSSLPGDQNGAAAPSVPVSDFASNASSDWTHNDFPARPCATNAILVPSGESAGAPPSMSGANE